MSNLVSTRRYNGLGYDFAYDGLNRPVGMQTAGYPLSVGFSYAYDALSRRVSMSDSLRDRDAMGPDHYPEL